jgi:hypothetical protein
LKYPVFCDTIKTVVKSHEGWRRLKSPTKSLGGFLFPEKEIRLTKSDRKSIYQC